jgi:hypothetical protein
MVPNLANQYTIAMYKFSIKQQMKIVLCFCLFRPFGFKFLNALALTHHFILIFQTLAATCMDDQELTESMQKLLIVMQRLDEKIGPILEYGELFNKRYVSH